MPGGLYQSPLPFRVNAVTGEVGILRDEKQVEKLKYNYTSNWSATMNLLNELTKLRKGNIEEYKQSYNTILDWMKNYPLKTDAWGPFFEDVGLWSDTQINAITFAEFILENQQLFPNWKNDSFKVIDWVYEELANDKWEKYGVAAVNEQTHYRVPGNSHTARQGAIELLYSSKTGDDFRKSVGIKQLNWATYMVNIDGENTYPNNETWLTDGYGDYVRHYLKAMGIFPELAPKNQNHLVKSSSVIKFIHYKKNEIKYEVFDDESTEVLRLTTKPKKIFVNNMPLRQSRKADTNNFWKWTSLDKGGVLSINKINGSKIIIEL